MLFVWCDKQQHIIQGQKDPPSSSAGEEGGSVWGLFKYLCAVTLWLCWLSKDSNKHFYIFKVLTDTISLNLLEKENKKMIATDKQII